MTFSCSHRSCQINKNKVFEFFLLPLKLLILLVSKFCLINPNLATQRMLQILSVSENLRKGNRINRSNLCLDEVFAHWVVSFFTFNGKLFF